MTEFYSQRIVLARHLRGRTKRDLATALGKSEAILSMWETGRRRPEPENQLHIAQELRQPIEFFQKDTVSLAPSDTVSFRSLRSMTVRTREQACAAASVAGDVAAWIDRNYALPSVNLPDLADAPPAVAAAMMRTHFKLGYDPLPSMVALLESCGIRCLALGLDLPKADALSTWIDDVPVVLFNVMKSAERGRNDAAHELGHLVLHRHQPAAGELAEQQAIEFAAHFLLPAESISRDAPRVWSMGALIDMKRYWGVSASFMLKRLTTLRLISDWSARLLWQRLASAGYRSGEPDGGPREHSQILAQVVQHLRTSKRSLAHVAREIAIANEDVRARVEGMLPFSLAATGASGESGPVQPATPPALRLMR